MDHRYKNNHILMSLRSIVLFMKKCQAQSVANRYLISLAPAILIKMNLKDQIELTCNNQIRQIKKENEIQIH